MDLIYSLSIKSKNNHKKQQKKMKTKIISALATAVCATMFCACHFLNHDSISQTELVRNTYPNNAYKPIPMEYMRPCEKGGTLSRFTYKTRNNQIPGSPEFEKYAVIYLPYGYDENNASKRYDVLYMMHGGAVDQEWFFGREGQRSPLKNILDNMIQNGDMKPLIVCVVSFYTNYNRDATKNCLDFHYELKKDLMPVFEKKYHTYAQGTTLEDFKASRGHRAFTGYSMGACGTWAAFEFCIDEIKYFLPMSGDCWNIGQNRYAETAEHLCKMLKEKGKTSNDFKIYAGAGTRDMAEPNLTPFVNELKKHPDTFLYTDNFGTGNLYHCIVPNGGHDLNTAMQLLYNGLPKTFD